MRIPVEPHDPIAPTIVGRERELGILRGAWSAALAGQGSAILIGGEAGIGKTALAEQLCREAVAEGAAILVGRSYEQMDPSPYAPWCELFATLPAAGCPASLPPAPLSVAREERSQGSIVEQVWDYLAAWAAHRPLVILLDDLHWADDSSLRLLRALARRVMGASLLIVGTLRIEEASEVLTALLPQLMREAGAQRLVLRRLTLAETADVIALHHPASAGRPGLVAALHTRTAGNPLFLIESLRDLLETEATSATWAAAALDSRLPETIREVLEARLRRLPTATQEFLEVAALLGESFDAEIVGDALGLGGRAVAARLERALAARLLREDGPADQVSFVHPLIPRALVDRQSSRRRRARHGMIATALSMRQVAGQGDWTELLARQLRAAGRGAEAIPYLLAAARRAAAFHAELAAAQLYRAALAEIPAEDAAGRSHLLNELGWVLRHIDGSAALSALDEALGEGCRAGHAGLVGRAQSRLGLLRCFAGDIIVGLALTRRGVETLEHRPDGAAEERAEAAGNWHSLAMWYALVGRYREALAAVGRSVALHRSLPPALVPSWATPFEQLENILNFTHAMLGRPVEARAATMRRRAMYYAERNLKMVAAMLDEEIRFVFLPYHLDDWAEIDVLLHERDRADAVARAEVGTIEPPRAACRVLFLRGAWDDATRLLDDPAVWTDTLLIHAHGRATLRAELLLARGDRDGTRDNLREVLPEGPSTPPGGGEHPTQLAALLLGATLARQEGDLPLARAYLDAHERWLAWSGAVLGRAEGVLARAELARARHERTAHTYAETARAQAMTIGDQLTLCRAWRLLGELAHDAAHADTALRESLAIAEQCRLPYESALTQLALARSHRRAGEDGPAREVAGAALATFARLRAAPALAAATAFLAEPARPTAASLDSGLTAREAEILRLVAEGLPNRAIAACLSISPRTVSTHLEHIYAKLGVTTRTAAAKIALRDAL